uniref:hypothetical protein n=1 Tax=Falsiroseomonas oryzae TaxID=2766473 RepID=UPI0022EB0B12
MCEFCWEELGARILAAALRGAPSPAAFDAPWCQPMVLQEGVRGVPESVAAPVTRRCLAIEAAWRAGAASARPFLPEGHRF